MKIRLSFKDPDILYDSGIEEKVRDSLPEGLSKEEREESVRALITDLWMEYGEYLEVEFDTEARTARVVGRGEKP